MRRRSLAILAHATRTGCLVATFAGALAAGVVLHANMPAVRRLTAEVANEAMRSLFDGKIVARDVTSLSIGRTTRVHVREAELTSPDGVRLILANDVEAEIDLARLLGSLATTGSPDVELDDVRIGKADVALDVDAEGTLGLTRAFKRRSPPSAPAPAPTPTPLAPPPGPAPSSPVVHVKRAWLGQTHVHGNLVPPALDGDAVDVHASVALESNALKVTLENGRLTLRSPGAPNQQAPLTGTTNGYLVVDLATTPTKLKGKVELQGACGAVPVIARAEIDGEQLEAEVDIARTDPTALATALSGVPLTKPVEIHAHARGKLPTIAIDARARVGESEVSAKGELDVREGKAFTLDVDASHLDAQALGAEIATDVSGKVHGDGTLGGSAGPQGTFRIVTSDGIVASQPVPAATIEGRFEPQRITAVLRAREPGVEATGKVEVDLATKAGTASDAGAGLRAPLVTFDLQARSDSLRALARAPNVVSGVASARARGKVDLAKGTIQATTTLSADSVTAAAFSAKHVTANGVLSGPLASPMLDVGFAGTDMQVKARGKTPLAYPSASGHAKIALAPTPRVVDAEINVGQTGSAEAVTASARGVHVTNGVVEASGLRVTGLGEPLELDARVGRGTWSIRAKSAGVDLRRAALVTGIKELETFPEGTRATLDVDVRQGSEGANGHLDVVLRSEKGLTGNGALTVEVHAKIDRGKLVGNGKIAAEGFGQVEATHAELDVPRQLDARSLARTTGVIELRGAVDLSQGAALFAGENVERVAGIASFEARIERGDPTSLPAVRGTVRTEGLEIALSGEPPSPTVLITGVDVQTHVAWDGRSEDAEVALLSWDKHGLLGSAGMKLKAPLVAWATGTKKLDARAVADLDIAAVAQMPPRDVSELPSFVGAPMLRGKVESSVVLSGTVGHPRVIVSGRARGIREDRRKSPGPPSFDPLDGTLEARWDGERAAVTFAIDERERRRRAPNPNRDPKAAPLPPERQPKRPRGHLRGLVIVTDVRMDDLLHGKTPAQLSWAASTELEVENLELRALPFLPAGMSGTVTGRARVKDLNRDPSFEAKAHVDGFGTGGARVESLDLTAGGRDASLFAHAAIVDHREHDPTQVTIQLASKSLRVKGVHVSWDHAAPTRLDYAIQNGRLALLTPLVKSSISEIDGRVDGAGSVTIDETSQLFEGGLAVQDARLYVNVLGEEIASLNGTAKFERTGVFRIDDASGKMGSGEFRASANGQMQGLRFMGAEATIVASKDGIPISSEGATFAEATGEAKISAKMSEDRKTIEMTIDLPRANVDIPDRDTQSLQSLDPDPTVSVGVRRRNGELDSSAVRKSRGGTGKQGSTAKVSDNLAARMNVALGDDVRLTGRGLDVRIGGRTLVELAEELDVTGRVDVRGGTIEVHGRRFTVDRGTVTFPDGGDPTNPTVVAAAYWDAPDRTRVWVEFTGPLKTGNLTLRSEPPYSKNEILSVLLFGRPDPNVATTGGQTGDSSGATAVGSGFVAADVNRALSQFDKDVDVETDTLSGNRTRIKVGRSFFDRRLKVQVAPTLGRATYREPDTYYLFLNWQFIPKWSIVAQRGDKGTSILDLLFQHRY